MTVDLTAFTELLRRVVTQFPTHKQLAKEIGISPTRLSHALSGTGQHAFNLENCLRLARVANVPPLDVLRAAKKDDEAKLLEFFRFGTSDLTPAERELIGRWKQLEPDDHVAIFALMERLEALHRLRLQGHAGAAQSSARSPDLPGGRVVSARRRGGHGR